MKASEVKTLLEEHIAKFGDSPLLIEYRVYEGKRGDNTVSYGILRREVRDARVIDRAEQKCLVLCE